MISAKKNEHRTVAVCLGVTACIALILTGCGSRPVASEATQGALLAASKPLSLSQITIGAVPAGDTWTAYVALAKGYFKDEGLNVTLVPFASGVALGTALIGGSIDFAMEGPNTVWAGILQGADLKSIMATELGIDGQIIMSRTYATAHGLTDKSSPVKIIKALRGASIAVSPPGGSLYAWTSLLLSKAGINPRKDATLVPIAGGSAQLAAFEAGRVDAWVFLTPSTTEAVTRDHALAVNLSDDPEVPQFSNWPVDTYATTQTTILNHPDTVQALTVAVLRAANFITHNRKAATAILSESRFLGPLPAGGTNLDFHNISNGVLLNAKSFAAEVVINEAIFGKSLKSFTPSDVEDLTFGAKAAKELQALKKK